MINKKYDMTIDFVTGKKIPDIGSEANRQAVEKFLVAEKGYAKDDIAVDVRIELVIAGTPYQSQIDLVVQVEGTRFMAIKCAAGSLGSREREILAAARLLDNYQIPVSMVSDGRTAIVLDTLSGKKLGEGLDEVPSKKEAIEKLDREELQPFPTERREREKLIFRSYDMMNINVSRNLE
jgi:hypothetical protein